MKNVLFFLLLISAGAYGMDDFEKFNDLGTIDQQLWDEVSSMAKTDDSQILDIIYKEYDDRKQYDAKLENGDGIHASFFTKGLQAGCYVCQRSRNFLPIPLYDVVYHRLAKLYKERNSSQAKQVAQNSSSDFHATSCMESSPRVTNWKEVFLKKDIEELERKISIAETEWHRALSETHIFEDLWSRHAVDHQESAVRAQRVGRRVSELQVELELKRAALKLEQESRT